MIRIFSIIIPARVFTLFVSEIGLLFACFATASYFDSDIGDASLFLVYDSGLFRIGIVVGLLLLGLFFFNQYADVRIRSRLGLLRNLCLVFGTAFLGEGLIGYLKPDWIIPRKIMLIGTVLAFTVLYGWRTLFDSAAKHAVAALRVLFLGMSPTVARIVEHFQSHPELGLISIGYLDCGGSKDCGTIPRLGAIEDLETILDQDTPESIVIGNRDDIRPWWTDEFLALRFGGVQVQEAGTLYERIFARKCVADIWPSNTIFDTTTDPNALDASMQSAYSWLVALIVAVVTLPLTLTIALLIRLGSRGPALTSETRVGLHGKPFQAFRFRCAAPDGAITPIGRFLQRQGLVWLPQLLNVIKGQMVMVGPRPERPLFASRLTELIPVYGLRNRVKPGMTGWARIHRKRGDQQDSVKDFEYDLYYLENLSPLMDFFIILLSLKSSEEPGESAA